MNNSTGAAPPCYVCGQHRDANIHLSRYAYDRFHRYRAGPATTLKDMLEVLDTMDESIPHGVQRVVTALEDADHNSHEIINHPRFMRWVETHRYQIEWWTACPPIS